MNKLFKNNRYNQISLFTNITEALTKLYNEDTSLFKAKFHHSLTHRLAMYLEDELRNPEESGHLFDNDVYVDVSYSIPWLENKKISDLVIHRRGNNPFMAANISNKYFSNEYLYELFKAQQKNPDGLYLAIRIANDQQYALIYKCDKDGIEYYHYYYVSGFSTMSRKKKINNIEIKNKSQLKLFKR